LNTSPRGMTGAAEGISGKGSGSRLRGNDKVAGGKKGVWVWVWVWVVSYLFCCSVPKLRGLYMEFI
ncbi:MAG: hypothetical protein NTV01_00990, partial [Bacteroidia bacterium]|nr:hypothetical protein [Bacteroidia bacterium]